MRAFHRISRHVLAAVAFCPLGAAPAYAQIAASVPADFTVAAVGDMIQTRPIVPIIEGQSPELLKILQDADVTFGNYETTALDFSAFDGHPEAPNGGSTIFSEKTVPADLKAMGFDIVSRANNHVTDWGVKGMQISNRLLDDAGVTHAGSGDSLMAARAGRFYDTAAGQRVGLVSMASTFVPSSRAEDPLGEVRGRPGLSALRLKRTLTVSPERLAELAQIRSGRPYDLMERQPTPTDVDFFGVQFRSVAGQQGTGISFKADPRDELQILSAIRQAKQTSDYVIATIHAHEPGNYAEIPDFLMDFARKSIDAGADQFIGHGPHQLRGIEIYKGRPIFYSLGNFSFMLNDMRPLTPDFYEMAAVPQQPGQTPAEYSESFRKTWFGEPYWWESVVAVTRNNPDGTFAEVRLYPIELNLAAADRNKGVPRLAPPAVANKVLAHLRDLSAPLGTVITIENGVGVIRSGGARR